MGPSTVADRFRLGGPVLDVHPHPGGHIHDSWVVRCELARFLLQRLNANVFPDIALMMDNVVRVAEHMGSVNVVRSHEDEPFIVDDGGRSWRAFAFIEGARSPDKVTAPAQARQLGSALGTFHVKVQELPGPPPMPAIPGFKDFARRRDTFEAMVSADPAGRAGAVGPEIAGVRRSHHLVDDLGQARAAGRLPERIVHNDAKAANVLLDEATGAWVAVVDLDTVAPGTLLIDLGDLLRTAAVDVAEDAALGTGVAVREDLLTAALDGHLVAAGALLTADEIALLPLAGPLMAYESALRFLTDYLEGDVYFRVARPDHNLHRARAQLGIIDALAAAGRETPLWPR